MPSRVAHVNRPYLRGGARRVFVGKADCVDKAMGVERRQGLGGEQGRGFGSPRTGLSVLN